MRRFILMFSVLAILSVIIPAHATSCSTTSPDDNNRQQCAPLNCTLTQTTPCSEQRKIDTFTAGQPGAGADIGGNNVNDPNTFIGYCKNNVSPSNPGACELITPSEAQSLATSQATCWSAFNPTTQPWTKCVPSEQDPEGHNVGRWIRVSRGNLARPARCLYLADDSQAVAQPNHEGKLGYVFEQNIPAGGPSSTAVSWIGRYWKLEAIGDTSADFDLYFYAYLGQAVCANEATTTSTQPEQPTPDIGSSTYSTPGNEHGYIPPCTNTAPIVSNCIGAGSAAVVNGQAWYSVIITMFTGKPQSTFKFTVCPTASAC